MAISKEGLDELLKGCERPGDLPGEAGLMKVLKNKAMARMLGGGTDRASTARQRTASRAFARRSQRPLRRP